MTVPVSRSQKYQSSEDGALHLQEGGANRVVFHTDISVKRMDVVIQQLMKLKKSVFEGTDLQDALDAV